MNETEQRRMSRDYGLNCTNYNEAQQQASAGEVPENPQAFPQGAAWDGPKGGMTLRDWFAGQALVGMGTWMPAYSSASLLSPSGLEDRALWAYEQADAMLRARGVTVAKGGE